MTEGPYYIVVEGTNLCDMTVVGKDAYQPKIFDTEDIAQTNINDSVEYRKRVGLGPPPRRVPISVAEYNEKYGSIMGIKED